MPGKERDKGTEELFDTMSEDFLQISQLPTKQITGSSEDTKQFNGCPSPPQKKNCIWAYNFYTTENQR